MKILFVLVLLLFIAAVFDGIKGRIPNVLLIFGALFGIFRLLYYRDFLSCLPGILLPMILLFPLYRIGVLGAGDIKLFGVLGFYFPFMENCFCIFIAFVLGAAASIFYFIRHENFYERMSYLFSYLKKCLFLGHFQYYYLDPDGKQISHSLECSSKIPLAIPIFISVLLHVGGVF